MSTPSSGSIPPHIEARVAMINGNFSLPEETKAAMTHIREVISEAGKALHMLLQVNPKLKYDVGRITAALDKLQDAKDTACAALILPHHQQQ